MDFAKLKCGPIAIQWSKYDHSFLWNLGDPLTPGKWLTDLSGNTKGTDFAIVARPLLLNGLNTTYVSVNWVLNWDRVCPLPCFRISPFWFKNPLHQSEAWSHGESWRVVVCPKNVCKVRQITRLFLVVFSQKNILDQIIFKTHNIFLTIKRCNLVMFGK